MKSVFLLFTLLAAINVDRCFSSSVKLSQSIQYDILRRIRTVYASSCEELDAPLESFKNCSNANENTESGCSAFTNYFERCSKPFFDSLKTCCPPQAKDVPDLIVHSVLNAASFICKSDGEHVFEFFNHCLWSRSEERRSCEKAADERFKQFRTAAPTRSELCEALHSAENCFLDFLKKSCGKITQESVLGVYRSLTAPCNTTTNIPLGINKV